MIHQVDFTGWKNPYCVPTALAFLTGTPLIHTHSRIAFHMDQAIQDITAVSTDTAVLILKEQGFSSKELDLPSKYEEKPTLKKFMKNLTAYEKCLPLMICIIGPNKFSHMIVSHFGYIADNHTKKAVPTEIYLYRNKYVSRAWTVTPPKGA